MTGWVPAGYDSVGRADESGAWSGVDAGRWMYVQGAVRSSTYGEEVNGHLGQTKMIIWLYGSGHPTKGAPPQNGCSFFPLEISVLRTGNCASGFGCAYFLHKVFMPLEKTSCWDCMGMRSIANIRRDEIVWS